MKQKKLFERFNNIIQRRNRILRHTRQINSISRNCYRNSFSKFSDSWAFCSLQYTIRTSQITEIQFVLLRVKITTILRLVIHLLRCSSLLSSSIWKNLADRS